MKDLSEKTIVELRELARVCKVATCTEISRDRKSTLLEWLEQSEGKSAKVTAAETQGTRGTLQGELFPSSLDYEEDEQPVAETETAQTAEPTQASSSSTTESK